MPSHYCGIAGIRPTSGRVPRTGHIISYDMGALDALTQIGPMARFVRDLILALPIIVGMDWYDPAIVPMPLGDPNSIDLKGLRVAFFTDNGIESPTPETADVVRSAARVLSEEGLSVQQDSPPGVDKSRELWHQLLHADGGAKVRQLLESAGTSKMHPVIEWTQSEKALTTTEFANLLAEWNMFRSRMLTFMENYDVIISPTSASPAIPHGTITSSTFSYTSHHNLTGWPGAVVRGGTSPEGLPIGVQVVARPWREDVALAVAQYLETALGGWQPPPL